MFYSGESRLHGLNRLLLHLLDTFPDQVNGVTLVFHLVLPALQPHEGLFDLFDEKLFGHSFSLVSCIESENHMLRMPAGEALLTNVILTTVDTEVVMM